MAIVWPVGNVKRRNIQFCTGTGRTANLGLSLRKVPLVARRIYQGFPPRREARDQRAKSPIWADGGGTSLREARGGKRTLPVGARRSATLGKSRPAKVSEANFIFCSFQRMGPSLTRTVEAAREA
jgi:hypothetical protein